MKYGAVTSRTSDRPTAKNYCDISSLDLYGLWQSMAQKNHPTLSMVKLAFYFIFGR